MKTDVACTSTSSPSRLDSQAPARGERRCHAADCPRPAVGSLMDRPCCPAHAIATVRNCWVLGTIAVVLLSMLTTPIACSIAKQEGWSADAFAMLLSGGLPWWLGVRAELEHALLRFRNR